MLSLSFQQSLTGFVHLHPHSGGLGELDDKSVQKQKASVNADMFFYVPAHFRLFDAKMFFTVSLLEVLAEYMHFDEMKAMFMPLHKGRDRTTL